MGVRDAESPIPGEGDGGSTDAAKGGAASVGAAASCAAGGSDSGGAVVEVLVVKLAEAGAAMPRPKTAARITTSARPRFSPIGLVPMGRF